MKTQILFFFSILLLTITASAQTSKAKTKATQQKTKPAVKKSTSLKQSASKEIKGWSAEEKTAFFETCMKDLNWGKDSASQYCNCMLVKIEKLYPSVIDSEKMTDEKALELARECLAIEGLPSGWGARARTQFTSQCETAATKNLGADKAKSYCSCMLVKVEKEFPNPADLPQMKQEMVAKWAEECVKQ